MTKRTFIQLVRLGIGHDADFSPVDIDWSEVEALAIRQELSAVVVDGIERLPDSSRPPKELLLQWIGSVLQGYEYRYEHYRRAIAELAGWYNSHGFKMMVLKGYACGMDWPKPEHRSYGDIDIWQFGTQKEADDALKKDLNINIDLSHHHHTVFYWKNFAVENHYDFINIYHHKSNSRVEKTLKALGSDDSHFIDLYGEKVYIPSPNLHALFLLRHTLAEFAASKISLRQILDWAFFIKNHGSEVDWKYLMSLLEEYHMMDFLNCVNAICVNHLGFDARYFPYIHYNSILTERVFNDILSPEYDGEEPDQLIPRLLFKYKRWRANEWKHKLCYKESMWSSFWYGVKNHLLKPSSI